MACGHYVGVVKVDGEYVRCQDNSFEDDVRSIQAPGRIMTARETLDANWHDKDAADASGLTVRHAPSLSVFHPCFIRG